MYTGLKELLENAFSDGPIKYEMPNPVGGNNLIEDYSLQRDFLLMKEEEIKNLDIFKDANLKIIHQPNLVLNNKIYSAKSFKIEEDTKITGDCYLYSIQWTPEIYNPEILKFNDNEKIRVGPTCYNPEDFKPYNNIIFRLCKEDLKDNDAIFGKENNPLRKEYHDLLDEALENPDKFKVKGERGIILRGVFENIKTKENNYKTDIDSNAKFLQSFNVFFMDAHLGKNSPKNFGEEHLKNESSEIILRLESRAIPEILRDEFLKNFNLKDLMDTKKLTESLKDPNVKSTKDKIDDFLKEHQFTIAKYY